MPLNVLSVSLMVLTVSRCGVFVLKGGKIKCMNGLKIPSDDVMKQIKVTVCQYLEILEMDNLRDKE